MLKRSWTIPEIFFWEEILEAFPDSKVILSEREEDSWLKSMVNQLQVAEAVISRRFLAVLSPTSRKLIFILYSHLTAILGSANPKSACVLRKRYRMHNHLFHQRSCWCTTWSKAGNRCVISWVATFQQLPSHMRISKAKLLKFLCRRQGLVGR